MERTERSARAPMPAVMVPPPPQSTKLPQQTESAAATQESPPEVSESPARSDTIKSLITRDLKTSDYYYPIFAKTRLLSKVAGYATLAFAAAVFGGPRLAELIGSTPDFLSNIMDFAQKGLPYSTLGFLLPWLGTSVVKTSEYEQLALKRLGGLCHTIGGKNGGPTLKLPDGLHDIYAAIDTRQHKIEKNLHVRTKDDPDMGLPLAIHFCIEDGDKFMSAEDPINQMTDLVLNVVKAVANTKSAEELFESRGDIRTAVLGALHKKNSGLKRNVMLLPKETRDILGSIEPVATKILKTLGIRILDVLPYEPRYSPKIGAAIAAQQAVKITAEAERAEREIQAQGDSAYIQGITSAIKEMAADLNMDYGTAASLYLAERGIQAQIQVGENGNMIVFSGGDTSENLTAMLARGTKAPAGRVSGATPHRVLR